MSRREHISTLGIALVLGVLPLIRFSLEDTFLTRHTWSWLGGIFCALFLIILMNLKRVHASKIPPILIALGLPIISSAIGMLPIQPTAILYIESAITIIVCTILVIPKQYAAYILYTFICIASLSAQWGIAQYITQRDMGLSFIGESIITTTTSGVATYYQGTEKFIRAYGPFGHPNSLAGVLVLSMLVYAYLIPKKISLFDMSILATLFLGVMLTFSRSALLAAILVLIAIAMKTRKNFITPILVIALCLSPLMLVRTTDNHDLATHDRLEGLRWACEITSPSSFVRGLGIGNYEQALIQYLTQHNIPHNPWDIAPVHSTPVQVLMETGIIFITLILSIIFFFIKKHNLWLFLLLLPPLLVDHYFFTQFAPFIFLATSAIVTARVYY